MTLVEYLRLHEMTLTEFANSIGAPLQTVHGWLTGRRRPRLAAAAAVERATDGAVRVGDFVTEARPRAAQPNTERAATSSAAASAF